MYKTKLENKKAVLFFLVLIVLSILLISTSLAANNSYSQNESDSPLDRNLELTFLRDGYKLIQTIREEIEFNLPVKWISIISDGLLNYTVKYETPEINLEVNETLSGLNWSKNLTFKTNYSEGYYNVTYAGMLPASTNVSVNPDLNYSFDEYNVVEFTLPYLKEKQSFMFSGIIDPDAEVKLNDNYFMDLASLESPVAILDYFALGEEYQLYIPIEYHGSNYVMHNITRYPLLNGASVKWLLYLEDEGIIIPLIFETPPIEFNKSKLANWNETITLNLNGTKLCLEEDCYNENKNSLTFKNNFGIFELISEQGDLDYFNVEFLDEEFLINLEISSLTYESNTKINLTLPFNVPEDKEIFLTYFDEENKEYSLGYDLSEFRNQISIELKDGFIDSDLIIDGQIKFNFSIELPDLDFESLSFSDLNISINQSNETELLEENLFDVILNKQFYSLNDLVTIKVKPANSSAYLYLLDPDGEISVIENNSFIVDKYGEYLIEASIYYQNMAETLYYVLNVSNTTTEYSFLNKSILVTTLENQYFSSQDEINSFEVILEIPEDLELLAGEIEQYEEELAEPTSSEIENQNEISSMQVNSEEVNSMSLFVGDSTETMSLTSISNPKIDELKQKVKQKKKILEKEVNNKFNATLLLNKSTSIKQIKFKNLHIENSSISLGVKDVQVDNTEQAYALDPEQMQFDSATVTVKAKGYYLYKCKDWDFEKQECPPVTKECFGETKDNVYCIEHGGWKKLMKITPGEEYNFTLSLQDPGFAEYSATYTAPYCSQGESPCIANSSLLKCRDNVGDGNGPEPNSPNTIDSCSDGTSIYEDPSCGGDESVENITIRSLNHSYFMKGDTVEVTAWVYCWGSGNQDNLNFVYTNDASATSPSWTVKAFNDPCPGGGYVSAAHNITLDNVAGDHAFRVINEYRGDTSMTCSVDDYGDNDDLVIKVHDYPTIPPLVTNISANNVTFDGTVNLIAKVIIDPAIYYYDVNVSYVKAIINHSNGSQTNITLTDPDKNNFYTGSFSQTDIRGRYNITIWANDTLDNVNNTETSFFNVNYKNLALTTDKQSYVKGGNVTYQGTGFDSYNNVSIVIYDPTLDPLTGYPINLTSGSSGNISSYWDVPLDVDLGTYTINATDADNPSRTIEQTFNVVTAIISGDSLNYVQGDLVNITGSNWDNNVNVTINIQCPTCGSIAGYPKNVTSNGTGYVNDTWQIPFNAILGSYNITAFQPTDLDKEDSFDFTISKRISSVISNNDWYKNGETVYINGTNFSFNNNITIDIKNSSDVSVSNYPKNITSNGTGFANDTWSLSGMNLGIYNISMFDYNYNNLKDYTFIEIVTQQILTDSSSYSSGDSVQITGYYWDRNLNVTVDLKNSTGSSMTGYPKNITSNSTGGFTDSWTAEPGSGLGAETYNLTAWEAADSTENDTTSFDVTKTATLSVAGYYFDQNQTVLISGDYYNPDGDVEIDIRKISTGASAQGYPKIISANSQGQITDSWNTSTFCQGEFVVEAVDQTYPAQLFANDTFEIFYYESVAHNYNFSITTDKDAFDNDNLDAGENIPPADWTEINNMNPWYACYYPQGDADELTSTNYANIASDNSVYYMFRGTFNDYACVGTEWEVDESLDLMEAINISLDGYIQTANRHINVYARNWTSGRWNHLSRLTITSATSPGETHSVQISSNLDDYLDTNDKMRVMFIGEETNTDYYADYIYLDVTYKSQISRSGCSGFDTIEPTVEDLDVTPDPQTLDSSVLIEANVSDASGISYVKAIVDLNNGSQFNLSMTDDNLDGRYNCTFTNTDILGVHNITIWANDSWNNINNTEETNFTITYNTLTLTTNKQSYIVGGTVLISGNGYSANKNVTINILNSTGQSVATYPKNVTSNSSGQISDSWVIPGGQSLGDYVVNATDTINSSRTKNKTFKIVTAVIEGDYSSYEQGALVNITGSNWGLNTNVTINITNPSDSVVYGPLNLTSDGSGNINDTWNIPYNADLGDYDLYAIQPSNPNKNNTFVFAVTQRAVLVTTNYPWYKRDDSIEINGTGFSNSSTINIDIYNSTGNSVATYPTTIISNATGYANDTWLIPAAQNLGTYNVSLNDSSYSNLLNQTSFSIVLQNAQTDQSAYSSGDTVYITGTYWDRNTNVTIDIINSTSDSASGYPKDVLVSPTGTISDVWTAQPGSGFGAEQYNISVQQKLDATENDTITIDVTKAATLDTNKNLYLPNENVTITGDFYAQSDDVEINIISLSNDGHAQNYPKIITSNSSGGITHYWNVSNFCEGVYRAESEDQTYPAQLNANTTFNVSYNNPSQITCTQVWGSDCSAWPAASEGDNTFDACGTSAGTDTDEHVDGGYLNMTIANPGDVVSVTCNFVPYASGGTELYIYYYDTTGWTQLYSFADTTGNTGSITRSTTITDNPGTHWFRCIADYDGENDECASGSWFDNDDISLTVVSEPSSCDIFDIIPPNVTSIVPSENTDYNLTDVFDINATVVDNTNVSFVKAIIDHSNGTQTNITMTDIDDDDVYNCSFSATSVIGRYNITIWANDTWNVINNSETTYFNVNDLIYPNWTLNKTSPASGVNYSPTQNYQFNITWNENYELDTITIEHNFTGILDNYTAIQNSSNEYYYDYGAIGAGNYVWKMYANDTSGNMNQTDQFNFVVNKDAGLVNLTLDSNTDNLTVEVNSIVNITGVLINPSSGSLVLYENGSLINSGSSPLVNLTNYTSLGLYNLTLLFDETDNYTADSDEWWLTVEDTTNPLVIINEPDASKFNTSENVTFNITVTDNYEVDTVLANLTWLSGNELIELSDDDLDTYYFVNYTSSVAGRYNYTMLVTDTSNNKNYTQENYFILLEDPLVETNKQSYVRGGNLILNAYGFNLNTNVTVNIFNSTGDSITDYPKNITSNSTGGLNDSWSIPGGEPLGQYFINLTDTLESNRKANTTFDIVTAVIEANKNSFIQGDIINISGNTWDASVNVTVNITNPSSALVYGNLNLTSNSSGEVNDTWQVPYNAELGSYLMSAIQPFYTNKNDTFTFSVTKRIVDISFPYSWYKRGNSFNLTGTGFSPLNNITIDIQDSLSSSLSGYPKNVTSNSSGGITNLISIPSDQSLDSYNITAIDYTYNNLNDSIQFEIVIQNLSTDSNAYSSGDTVYISGNYWDRNSNVTIDIQNSSLDSAPTYPLNVSVGLDGVLSSTWIAAPGSDSAVEPYNLTAEQADNASINEYTTFDVTRVATLNTDKEIYDQNEIVNITGSYYSSNADVEITINCLDNGGIAPYYPKNVTSDGSGNINDLWNTTDACAGNYSIDAVDQTYPEQLNQTTTFNVDFFELNSSLETVDASSLSGNYNVQGGTYSSTFTSNNVRQYFGGTDYNTEMQTWINYTYDVSGLNLNLEDINSLNLTLEYCFSGDQVGLSCGKGYPAEGIPIGTQDIEVWNFTSSSWLDIGDIPFDNTTDAENTSNYILSSAFDDLINNDELYFRLELNINSSESSNDAFLLIDYLGLNVSYHSHVSRDCTEFDVTDPVVTLLSPLDYSGDIDGNISFKYNVSDDSHVLSCTLTLNGEENKTENTIVRNTTQSIIVNNLPVSEYNWSISCMDNASTRNVGTSDTRNVDVIFATEYIGAEITNLSLVNTSNITNFYIKVDDEAKINFTETLDLSTGADLNSIVDIINKSVIIDSVSDPRLNTSAQLTIYNLSYGATPVVLRNGNICPGSICSGINYDSVSGDLIFNVTHFTKYNATANSELEIWDQTDTKEGSKVIYLNDNLKFYANYTNVTSGSPITGADAYCEFTENNTGGWSSLVNMTYNSSSGLYELTKSFSNNGTFDFNVSCYNSQNYENISLLDDYLIWHIAELQILNVSFSDTEYIENKDLTISVNVTNVGSKDSENMTLELNLSMWNGTKNFDETKLSSSFNLTGKTSRIINFAWTDKMGTYVFDFYVDNENNVTEYNETNNTYSLNITTPSWEIFYGDYNYSIILGDSVNSNFYNWSSQDGSINIYFSDVDSSYYPFNLEPITGPDLIEVDTALDIRGYNDSVKNLFDADNNNIPDNTISVEIGGSLLSNIPVVKSTNSSSFLTGLLWDGADNSIYTGNEDLVIMTIVNDSKSGKYGTYDYEIRIPGSLDIIKPGISAIVRYDEFD